MEKVIHDMLFLKYNPWDNNSAMCIKVDTVQVNIQLLIWDAAQLCPCFYMLAFSFLMLTSSRIDFNILLLVFKSLNGL